MTAAIKAKIRNFIFGAPTENDSDPYITVHDIAKHSKQELNIQTGILEKECSEQITAARNGK
jgi:tRNA(Arg) A34 adenosine deaminase TadA